MEAIDHAIATLKPDSFKGYTIGDNTNKDLSQHPWRMDDEKLVYPFYEKIVKAGLDNVCVHKGLFPPSVEQQFPQPRSPTPTSATSARRPRTGRSSTSSSITPRYRLAGGGAVRRTAWAQFEQTGRIEWVSDLAEIPAKYGVSNVYGDLGQIFAQTTVAEPRLCAALMGTLIKGMGADHVVLGHRRGMDRLAAVADRGAAPAGDSRGHAEAYGFTPLGPADGPVKTAILSGNSARLYRFEQHAALP